MSKKGKRIDYANFSEFYVLAEALILLGIVFRFIYLDRKVFWLDEACTLLRISGHAELDVLRQFSFDRIVSPATLQQYQQPQAGLGVSGTIQGLAPKNLSLLHSILWCCTVG